MSAWERRTSSGWNAWACPWSGTVAKPGSTPIPRRAQRAIRSVRPSLGKWARLVSARFIPTGRTLASASRSAGDGAKRPDVLRVFRCNGYAEDHHKLEDARLSRQRGPMGRVPRSLFLGANMDPITIIIGTSWTVIGFLQIGLAIPLVRGRIGRNYLYGV